MSLAAAKPELLTVEDYRATPEGSRYQLVEGELITAPAPNRFHQEIVWNLSQILGRHFSAHSVGKAYNAPFDVYLGEHDVYQPDVIFVSNERKTILTDDGAHGAPDLVIEVISPSIAQLDKKHKRRVYARAGVKELWLVDPILLQIHLNTRPSPSLAEADVGLAIGAPTGMLAPCLIGHNAGRWNAFPERSAVPGSSRALVFR